MIVLVAASSLETMEVSIAECGCGGWLIVLAIASPSKPPTIKCKGPLAACTKPSKTDGIRDAHPRMMAVITPLLLRLQEASSSKKRTLRCLLPLFQRQTNAHRASLRGRTVGDKAWNETRHEKRACVPVCMNCLPYDTGCCCCQCQSASLIPKILYSLCTYI